MGFDGKVEYAKSSRSSCRKCKSSIAQGTLRIAKLVQNPKFDGVMPQVNLFRVIRILSNQCCLNNYLSESTSGIINLVSGNGRDRVQHPLFLNLKVSIQ
eukprot:m.100957 g.100957  ORF g.100957 m.100957 type:complete len:99 (-) comp13730_c0_seq2:2933-3229(-)